MTDARTTSTEISQPSASVEDGPNRYRLASFFAGIGGFDLGFEQAGFDTVFQCEVDSFCKSILEKHWPQTHRTGDIESETAPEDIPDAEVWAAGFPCQDISVARGSRGRDGLNGSRSGLFFRFTELVESRLPPVIVLENVAGLRNSNEGRDFRLVLDVLQDLGYALAWRELNSRYFGVPQSRPRVFLIASRENPLLPAEVLFDGNGDWRQSSARQGFITEDTKPGIPAGPIVPQVSYCLAATSGRHTGTDWSRTYVSYTDRVRRLTPTECERLQGFPDGWTIPERSSNADRDDSLRYHALGNAVTVNVVRWIASRIRSSLNEESKLSQERRSRPEPSAPATSPVRSLAELEPRFTLEKSTFVELPHLNGEFKEGRTFKWAKAGYAFDRSGVQASLGPAPADPTVVTLGEIVETGAVSQRYFLTPNAANGILRRVESQGRTLFDPLYLALEQLATEQ